MLTHSLLLEGEMYGTSTLQNHPAAKWAIHLERKKKILNQPQPRSPEKTPLHATSTRKHGLAQQIETIPHRAFLEGFSLWDGSPDGRWSTTGGPTWFTQEEC